MQLAFPLPEGVKTPVEVMLPPVAVQVTALLKAPVPETVAVQAEVCAVVIEDGVAVTIMPVTVGADPVMAIAAVPDFVVS